MWSVLALHFSLVQTSPSHLLAFVDNKNDSFNSEKTHHASLAKWGFNGSRGWRELPSGLAGIRHLNNVTHMQLHKHPSVGEGINTISGGVATEGETT